MHVMLTKIQWESLFYWGLEQGCDGANEAGSLLLSILHQVMGDPPPLEELPPRIKGRKAGSPKYYAKVTIAPLAQSVKTRALWAWGSTAGCPTVAAAMRLLIDHMIDTYPDLGPNQTKPEKPRLDCLYALANHIEKIAEWHPPGAVLAPVANQT